MQWHADHAAPGDHARSAQPLEPLDRAARGGGRPAAVAARLVRQHQFMLDRPLHGNAAARRSPPRVRCARHFAQSGAARPELAVEPSSMPSRANAALPVATLSAAAASAQRAWMSACTSAPRRRAGSRRQHMRRGGIAHAGGRIDTPRRGARIASAVVDAALHRRAEQVGVARHEQFALADARLAGLVQVHAEVVMRPATPSAEEAQRPAARLGLRDSPRQ